MQFAAAVLQGPHSLDVAAVPPVGTRRAPARSDRHDRVRTTVTAMAERDSEPPRLILWRPVEPLLTHCLTVDAIDFHIRPESTSEGMWTDDPSVYDQAAKAGLWQQVTLHISAEWTGLGATTAVPVKIDFRGVVLFHFIQAELEANISRKQIIEMAYPANVDEWYDTGPLIGAPGWNVTEPRNRTGGFCLWTCDDSPLIDQLVSHWTMTKVFDRRSASTVVARASVFHHYQISQDDLGTFDLAATGVSVERQMGPR